MTETLWGQQSDFWTSDDEIESKVIDSPPRSPPPEQEDEDGTPEWLKAFDAERATFDDVVGEAEGFLETVLPSPEPNVSLPLTEGRFIRKKWVIEDKHDVSDFDEVLPKDERAFLHPFELDDFQKRAVLHIERREHTFVCAHTSAGKTVVAEYAIALAAKHNLRAVYTSPIKALSNQKFREFSQIFPSVGIITGDVSVNTKAQCLIMTTEILRALLYRGDALLAQLSVVIFDEVHYVSDPDRGVVWEETIIMLPSSVTMVMLSATVPNYLQFAEWIGTTKHREVFCVSTTFRPTPLRHYLWANNRAYLLMDHRNQFNTSAYNMIYSDARAAQKAKEQRAAAKAKSKAKAKQPTRQGPNPKFQTAEAKSKTERQRLQAFLEFLQTNNGLPVVCFCFSRKRSQQLAEQLPNIINVSADNKSKIHVFVKQALSGLNADDRQLPQIKIVESLVQRGVGIHHGGLLPIVKELVEILFSRGLIQVLFATETFAMGVNMPARSVLFTGIRKHDGRQNRPLLASEYIQIAGRAGRRGLDECGNVYILSVGDEPPMQNELQSMMLFRSTPLASRFRLTFSMILQLIYRRGMRPIDMISSSFKESSRAQQLPILRRDLARRKRELSELPQVDCIFGPKALHEYVTLEVKSRHLGHKLHLSLLNSKFASEVFCPGRVVLVHTLPFIPISCYGVIIDRHRGGLQDTGLSEQEQSKGTATRQAYQGASPQQTELINANFQLLVLIPRGSMIAAKDSLGDVSALEAETSLLINTNARVGKNVQVDYLGHLTHDTGATQAELRASDIEAAMSVVDGNYIPSRQYAVASGVPLSSIGSLMTEILSLPTEHWVSEVETDEPQARVMWYTRTAQSLDDLLVNCKGKLNSFTIPKKMRQIEIEHVVDATELRGITSQLVNHQCHLDPKRAENVRIMLRRRELERDIEDIDFQISDSSLDLVPELLAKIDVLKSRQFLEQNGSIALKGRAACEVMATDEISLLEAVFEHVLQDRSPEVIAAAVSAYVFPENNEDEDVIFSEEVEEVKERLTAIHNSIGEELCGRGVRLNWDDWNKLCNFKFAQVAWRWARGEPFTKLVEKTSLQEGTIVRTIVRLDELIRKVRMRYQCRFIPGLLQLKGVAHLVGNRELKDALTKTSELIHRDIVFASSLYIQ